MMKSHRHASGAERRSRSDGTDAKIADLTAQAIPIIDVDAQEDSVVVAVPNLLTGPGISSFDPSGAYSVSLVKDHRRTSSGSETGTKVRLVEVQASHDKSIKKMPSLKIGDVSAAADVNDDHSADRGEQEQNSDQAADVDIPAESNTGKVDAADDTPKRMDIDDEKVDIRKNTNGISVSTKVSMDIDDANDTTEASANAVKETVNTAEANGADARMTESVPIPSQNISEAESTHQQPEQKGHTATLKVPGSEIDLSQFFSRVNPNEVEKEPISVGYDTEEDSDSDEVAMDVDDTATNLNEKSQNKETLAAQVQKRLLQWAEDLNLRCNTFEGDMAQRIKNETDPDKIMMMVDILNDYLKRRQNPNNVPFKPPPPPRPTSVTLAPSLTGIQSPAPLQKSQNHFLPFSQQTVANLPSAKSSVSTSQPLRSEPVSIMQQSLPLRPNPSLLPKPALAQPRAPPQVPHPRNLAIPLQNLRSKLLFGQSTELPSVADALRNTSHQATTLNQQVEKSVTSQEEKINHLSQKDAALTDKTAALSQRNITLTENAIQKDQSDARKELRLSSNTVRSLLDCDSDEYEEETTTPSSVQLSEVASVPPSSTMDSSRFSQIDQESLDLASSLIDADEEPATNTDGANDSRHHSVDVNVDGMTIISSAETEKSKQNPTKEKEEDERAMLVREREKYRQMIEKEREDKKQMEQKRAAAEARRKRKEKEQKEQQKKRGKREETGIEKRTRQSKRRTPVPKEKEPKERTRRLRRGLDADKKSRQSARAAKAEALEKLKREREKKARIAEMIEEEQEEEQPKEQDEEQTHQLADADSIIYRPSVHWCVRVEGGSTKQDTNFSDGRFFTKVWSASYDRHSKEFQEWKAAPQRKRIGTFERSTNVKRKAVDRARPPVLLSRNVKEGKLRKKKRAQFDVSNRWWFDCGREKAVTLEELHEIQDWKLQALKYRIEHLQQQKKSKDLISAKQKRDALRAERSARRIKERKMDVAEEEEEEEEEEEIIMDDDDEEFTMDAVDVDEDQDDELETGEYELAASFSEESESEDEETSTRRRPKRTCTSNAPKRKERQKAREVVEVKEVNIMTRRSKRKSMDESEEKNGNPGARRKRARAEEEKDRTAKRQKVTEKRRDSDVVTAGVNMKRRKSRKQSNEEQGRKNRAKTGQTRERRTRAAKEKAEMTRESESSRRKAKESEAHSEKLRERVRKTREKAAERERQRKVVEEEGKEREKIEKAKNQRQSREPMDEDTLNALLKPRVNIVNDDRFKMVLGAARIEEESDEDYESVRSDVGAREAEDDEEYRAKTKTKSREKERRNGRKKEREYQERRQTERNAKNETQREKEKSARREKDKDKDKEKSVGKEKEKEKNKEKGAIAWVRAQDQPKLFEELAAAKLPDLDTLLTSPSNPSPRVSAQVPPPPRLFSQIIDNDE